MSKTKVKDMAIGVEEGTLFRRKEALGSYLSCHNHVPSMACLPFRHPQCLSIILVNLILRTLVRKGGIQS